MKLQEIVRREGIPDRVPAGTPSGWAAPELALAEGAQQTGVAAQRTGLVYAHAADLLQKAKAKAELEMATERLKVGFADDDIALRSAGTDPDEYPKAVADRLKARAVELGDGLSTPEAKAQWQGTVARFAGEKIVTAKYDALTMKRGQVKLMWATQDEEDANQAVFGGTPAERQAALGRGLERAQEGLNTGIYSADEAAAQRKGFLSRIEKGGVERDYRNPELRGGVIATLLEGGYRHLDAAWQIEKAKQLQGATDQEYKQTREALDKWWTEQQGAKVLELTKAAQNKTLSVAQLDVDAADWRLTGPQYTTIRKELTAPVEEGPSNSVVWDRVRADVHSIEPRYTEADLAGLRALGPEKGLNGKDYIAALDKRNATVTALTTRAHTIEGQQHAQAEQMGRAAFQIPPIYDRLEGNKGKVWSDYLEALTSRSKYMRGQENPLDVAEELIPRFKKMLGEEASRDVTYLKGMLNYQTLPELKAAKASGAITQGQYDAEVRVLMQLSDAMREHEANDLKASVEAAKRAEEDAKKKQGLLQRWLPSFGAPPANAPAAPKKNLGRE